MKFDLKKFLILNFPYALMFWFFNRVGEGYRLAAGADMVAKGMGAISSLGAIISSNPLPSFHPQDLLVGLIGAACIRAAVYIKAKNAKKYRHGVEYGSARWGNAQDIAPFINPVKRYTDFSELTTPMTKDDIIPTYILRRVECEWVKAGNHCPHIGPCPFVEQERYY